jgi:serine/alanine adding enzyme
MKLSNNIELLSYENNDERNKWLEICQFFSEIDVFYYPEYGKLFELHGDGEPLLFVYYQSEKDIIIYPFLKRPLRQISGLHNIKENLFDITSPYGYGGYLPSSSNIDMERFFAAFHNYCKGNNIISEFVRFHPVLENVRFVSKNINIKFSNETVCIDLREEIEDIWQKMESRCRNAIRKADKNGVEIFIDEDCHYLNKFISLYLNTMDRLTANNYYFFKEKWFYELFSSMKNNIVLFHATYNEEIIASAIFTYNNYIINYFLTGSIFTMRHLSATNLLLYKVLLWAKELGIKMFHFGGGYRLGDNLFMFKKSFSSLTKKYFVGCIIHDQIKYELMCNLKHKNNYCINDDYFPLYRYQSIDKNR